MSVTYAYGIWDCSLMDMHCRMVEESRRRNDTPTSSVRQILMLSINVQHYATINIVLDTMVNYIWKLMDNGYERRHLHLPTY